MREIPAAVCGRCVAEEAVCLRLCAYLRAVETSVSVILRTDCVPVLSNVIRTS